MDGKRIAKRLQIQCYYVTSGTVEDKPQLRRTSDNMFCEEIRLRCDVTFPCKQLHAVILELEIMQYFGGYPLIYRGLIAS